MSYVEVTYPKDKKEFYRVLIDQLKLYIGNESNVNLLFCKKVGKKLLLF